MLPPPRGSPKSMQVFGNGGENENEDRGRKCAGLSFTSLHVHFASYAYATIFIQARHIDVCRMYVVVR